MKAEELKGIRNEKEKEEMVRQIKSSKVKSKGYQHELKKKV